VINAVIVKRMILGETLCILTETQYDILLCYF